MYWVIFVVGAVISWGLYGPFLHMGQVELGIKGANLSAMRAMLCVGMAYFLLGVLLPGGVLATQGEDGQFNTKGVLIATFAGLLGAAGAFCIVYAFRNGGRPFYVMPLVFGGAPVINVIFSILKHPPQSKISPMLYLGFVMAAVGAGLVLRYKPE